MVFQLQQVTFIIFFVKFSYSSPKTSSRTHQSCPQRGISQVPGLAVMERSGDLSLPQVYFVFSGFWGTVSCDVKAGPQPPLHHGRHLNPFPLLAFYTTFTAAQVFNTDQSLLLSPSFITTSFLLFCSLLLIRFSFTVSAFTPCVPTMLLPLSSSRPVYLSLPPFFFPLTSFSRPSSFPLHFPSPTLPRFHHLLKGWVRPDAGNLALWLHRTCMNDTKPCPQYPLALSHDFNHY